MRRTAAILCAATMALAVAAPASAEGGKVRGDEGQGGVVQVVGPGTVVPPVPGR